MDQFIETHSDGNLYAFAIQSIQGYQIQYFQSFSGYPFIGPPPKAQYWASIKTAWDNFNNSMEAIIIKNIVIKN